MLLVVAAFWVWDNSLSEVETAVEVVETVETEEVELVALTVKETVEDPEVLPAESRTLTSKVCDPSSNGSELGTEYVQLPEASAEVVYDLVVLLTTKMMVELASAVPVKVGVKLSITAPLAGEIILAALGAVKSTVKDTKDVEETLE